MKLWCYGQRRDAPDEQIEALRKVHEEEPSTHDCGEWVTEEGKCALCDHALPHGFPRHLDKPHRG